MGIMRGELAWLFSDGGPLLLLQEELLPHWGGSDPLTGGSGAYGGPSVTSGRAPASDYDRACAVQGYLGLMRVGPGEGLVLGDEPMQTAWWRSAGQDADTLIRWQWADDEQT